ncbi:MAG: phage tail tape measure protein [Candidatus Dormibacteraeota bacterium]|nr:phage tail tape measure protein [Candidatus Dormibacteraeota bacterium]
MSGTLGSLLLGLGVNRSALTGGLGAAEAEVGKFEGATGGLMSKVGGHFEGGAKKVGGFATGVAGIGALGIDAGIVAIGTKAVEAATKFQSATVNVANSAKIPVAAAEELGKAFLGTSSDAQKMMDTYSLVAGQLGVVKGSALSTAEAVTYMKSANLLARVSGQDLDATTQSLAAALKGFNLQVTDAPKAANVLYNATRLTGAGFEEIVKGANKMQAKLGDAAPTLDEMGGLMLSLSDKGVKGSRGIMMITGGLEHMYSGTPAVSAELEKLGARVTDAHGKFLPLADILTQLQPKFAAMTEAQRQAAGAAIFGAGAAGTLDKIVVEGGKGLDKYIKQVGEKGALEQAGANRLDTFATQQAKLHNQIANTQILIGQQLLPVIQHLTDRLIPIITGVTSWAQANPGLATGLVLVLGGVVTLIPVIMALNLALAMNPIGLVVIAIAALVAGIIWAYFNFQPFHEIVNAVFGALAKGAGVVMPVVIAVFSWLVDNVLPVLVSAFGLVYASVKLWFDLLGVVIGWIGGFFGPPLKALGEMVAKGLGFKDLGDMVQHVWDALVGFGKFLVDIFTKNLKEAGKALDAITGILSNLDPNKRQSPSLVDRVGAGVTDIMGQYSRLSRLTIAPPRLAGFSAPVSQVNLEGPRAAAGGDGPSRPGSRGDGGRGDMAEIERLLGRAVDIWERAYNNRPAPAGATAAAARVGA